MTPLQKNSRVETPALDAVHLGGSIAKALNLSENKESITGLCWAGSSTVISCAGRRRRSKVM